MPISDAQRKAVEEVVTVLTTTSAGGRGKRLLADMFLDLPDRDAWSEYYEVISEPRCINGVKLKTVKHDKGGYKDALEAYDDLNLVFLNALYYNEEGSQIARDAITLKSVLVTEWKKHSELPAPRTSPPPKSRQKEEKKSATPAAIPAKPVPATRKSSTPKPSKPIAPAAVPMLAPPPQSAQDMDVDIEGTGNGSDNDNEVETTSYGYGGPSFGDKEGLARDAESDAIVRQLERGLPRWGGYGDKGWMEGISLERCAEIVHSIKAHKDIVSNSRVASVLDAIPEDASIKDLSFNQPLSLKIIEAKARAKEYTSSQEFDLDMVRLFEKGRRWYEIGSDQYGDVLLLQRLYQSLTSPTPPPGPPYTSQTHFSSIRAGPGIARPVHGSSVADVDLVSGVTTFRISTKDRHFVDEVYYKGWSIRLADWLHLANPDDPDRPIVAQVFKCWISDEPSKKGRPGVTACWYYRPEQTFHPLNREFWEGEVFKTGHFADHPLEDIIEKISCQFTARHLRGRPRPPFWYPGWPLYVCDSRYNDRERVFVRIKNWASCVPEEVRKKPEWMHIYEFERTVVPRRVVSPFAPGSAVKGRRGGRLPGGIGDAVERMDGERIEGGGTGRKRPKKMGSVNGPGTPSTAPPGPGPSRLPPTLGSGPGGASLVPQPSYTNTAYAAYGTQARPATTTPAPRQERSVLAAAGGAAIQASAFAEKLPPETTRHFDRDPETNEVLWFPGPPIDIAHPKGPQHSLEYLHFLAMKRKRKLEGDEKDDDGNAEQESPESKRVRSKVAAPPLASQLLSELLAAAEAP